MYYLYSNCQSSPTAWLILNKRRRTIKYTIYRHRALHFYYKNNNNNNIWYFAIKTYASRVNLCIIYPFPTSIFFLFSPIFFITYNIRISVANFKTFSAHTHTHTHYMSFPFSHARCSSSLENLPYYYHSSSIDILWITSNNIIINFTINVLHYINIIKQVKQMYKNIHRNMVKVNTT